MLKVYSSVVRLVWVLGLLGLLPCAAQEPGTNTDLPASSPSAQDMETVRTLLDKSSDDVDHDQLDAALQEVDAALQIDPQSSAAYEQRGSIYMQKKLWDLAEKDYTNASKIAPTEVAFKYKLAEIKFLQKSFEVARVRFAALQNDPSLGDISTYKVFLCDLLTGHEDVAGQDLARINNAERKPSYYFCNAVWNLFHQKPREANAFFNSAANIYSDQVNTLYFSSLNELKSIQAPEATFVTKDGTSYLQVKVFVEDEGLRVSSSAKGWVTIPFAQLPDDLSAFPFDVRAQIMTKRQVAPQAKTGTGLLSFTTKKGQRYDQVQWSMDETGLLLLTPQGRTTVPLDQLPEDLSGFPVELRTRLEAIRDSQTATTALASTLTFTTKNGKSYDRVKWGMDQTGLQVLTSEGWVSVPLAQLPDDLSAFPAALRAQIQAKRKAALSNEKPNVSFQPVESPKNGDSQKGSIVHDFSLLSPEQFNLYPAGARDNHFGRCVAMEGSTLVVGGNGATYVYEDNILTARLCPDADLTNTGDEVNAVSLSHQTLVAATHRAVYIWSKTPPGWQLQARLDIADASTVAVDGDHLVVGTDGKGNNHNTVSFFTREGETWRPAARVANHDGDTASADFYGHIADLRGAVAVIGAPNWSQSAYDNIGPDFSGRVFVERYEAGTWKEEAQLTANEPEIGTNLFGASVALSGNAIAISSSNRDMIDYAPHHGAVYLFQLTDEGWQKKAVLSSPTPADDQGFGRAPIVLAGPTLAIGDTNAKLKVPDVTLDNGQSAGQPGEIKHAGVVYVYENQVLQATLFAPDPVDSLRRDGSPDHYACCLAMDGDNLAVGARDKDGGTGIVYLWKRDNKQWQIVTELKGFHKQPDFNY